MDVNETVYQTKVTHAQNEVRAFMIISRPVRDEYMNAAEPEKTNIWSSKK